MITRIAQSEFIADLASRVHCGGGPGHMEVARMNAGAPRGAVARVGIGVAWVIPAPRGFAQGFPVCRKQRCDPRAEQGWTPLEAK